MGMSNCLLHGRMWTPPATLALEGWVTRLAEGFGDMRKAAHFAGVEYALIRRILRRAACGEPPPAGMAKPGSLRSARRAGAKPELRPPAAPPQPQLNLFAQNDLSLVNRGIQAFKNLELEKAVEFFEKHRSAYPKGYDISSRLAAAEFLLRGIREAPADPSHDRLICAVSGIPLRISPALTALAGMLLAPKSKALFLPG